MSLIISRWSFETGSWDPTPGLPPAPQEVIGLAYGFASKECNDFYFFSMSWFIFKGFFAFCGIGVCFSLNVNMDDESIWSSFILVVTVFFCDSKTSAVFLRLDLGLTVYYLTSSFLCLLSICFFSSISLSNYRPQFLKGQINLGVILSTLNPLLDLNGFNYSSSFLVSYP